MFLNTFYKIYLNQSQTFNLTKNKADGLINCFEIQSNNHQLGFIGKVDTIFSDKMHLDINEVFGFQLDLDLLMELANKTPLFNSIVSYPLVERDLNFVLEENILIGSLLSTVKENGNDILKSVDPINIFRHNSLGNNKKSVTINLVFQSSTKTLEDKDVNHVIDEIIRVISNEYGAKLR